MILVIDNYDSFVYNLVQYLGEFDTELEVCRNDQVTVDTVKELSPASIVISPGPGKPEDAGVSMDVFREVNCSVLGVCLGHQALCASAGSNVTHAPEVVHGKKSTITHDGSGIYEGIPNSMQVGRYHSLAVEQSDLPELLTVTAQTDDGVIMSVRHDIKPFIGVQYHPESILTHRGKSLIENFVDMCDE